MYRYSLGIIFICILLAYAFIDQDVPHGDKFNLECDLCHNPENWQVVQAKINFDHSRTNFPLYGAHRLTRCRACHLSLVFNTVGHNCVNCHTDIHQGEFGIGCEECHSPQSWENRQELYTKHNQTRFPLLGAHAMLDCEACHPKFLAPQFKMTSIECQGCHLQTYQQTIDPDHVKAGFDLACENCHSTAAWSWQNAVYHHTPLFPLSGGHARATCRDCHLNQYAGTSTLCFSCHETEYRSVTDPNHVSNNFDHDCSICHNTVDWSQVIFDHNLTSFPLTGTHTSVPCIQCHTNSYVNTPVACYGCHAADYNSASDPNHLTNNFDHDCSICHNTNTWQPASFDHANTNFPLSGAHLGLSCVQCHASGYNNIPSTCFACHEPDFSGTTDPNHVSNNFDHDCTLCHSTNSWQPSIFNHNQTNFPLTGAHLSITCIQCHSAGYVNTPSTCFACHESDYNGVSDPNHVSNNFNHDCTQCHSTSAWQPASFDHANTSFPLTGAHTAVSCVQCHSAGYINTPSECSSCHQQNYDQTTNPSHLAAHFPVQCNQCHNTTAWQPANWNHDSQYFPIYSGKHLNQWSTCSDCHINPNDFAVFSCLTCHEHNPTDTNAHHTEVPNYTYDSNACYSCHPTGISEGGN